MTAKKMADGFVDQALMQGFDREQAIEIASFAVDKIINYTDLPWIEETYWIEVMEELESMM